MCPKLEGIPAFVYSILWINKIYGRLRRKFSDLQVKIALYLTDFPPAFLIKIDKGNFEIELLEAVKNTKDLDDVECDCYVAAPTLIFYGGATSLIQGINKKLVEVKNPDIILTLGQLMGV